MARDRLIDGEEMPGDCHVARYCFYDSIETVEDEARQIIAPRAFEKGRNNRADVSFSAMEFFRGDDKEIILQVCKFRGGLRVADDGYYVKLNVGRIRESVFKAIRTQLPFLFKPGRNPAHANLYAQGLIVSVALASLATSEGTLFPVPTPVPGPADWEPGKHLDSLLPKKAS